MSSARRRFAFVSCLAILALGLFCGSASAGFMGDSVSVSLDVHTTGSAIIDVFTNAPATVATGVELTGVSDPGAPGDGLAWTVDLDDLSIKLRVVDINGAGPTSIDPLTLDISGLDAMTITGVMIGSQNDLGITPAMISFTGSSIFVYAPPGTLNLLLNGGDMTTELKLLIPEPSTLALALLGMAGAVALVRRRRRPS